MPTTACRVTTPTTLPQAALKYRRAKRYILREGTIKRIHVNQHVIRKNKKHNQTQNVITIQWRGKSYPVKTAEITGPSRVVYSPHKPLSCGAHVWVETKEKVIITL